MHGTSPVVKVLAAWLLGLMLAVAAGVVAVYLANTRVFGPAQQVRDYLQAMRDGNGERALGLLNAQVPQANPAMLDGAALKESAAALQNVKIGDPQPAGGNRVEIPVTYSTDGTLHSTSFTLQKSGTDWLFFDKWAFVAEKLPTIEVTVVNQDQATLNGMPVALPKGRNTFAVFYPGGFEGHYTSTNFAAPAEQTVVTGREDTSTARLNLATRATGRLIGTVEKQVNSFLDGCVNQRVLQPAGCPFYYATDNRISGPVQWKITQYPTVSIEPYNGAWMLKPLAGKATLTTTETDLFTGAQIPVSFGQPFAFTAKLDVTGDSATVTPHVDY